MIDLNLLWNFSDAWLELYQFSKWVRVWAVHLVVSPSKVSPKTNYKPGEPWDMVMMMMNREGLGIRRIRLCSSSSTSTHSTPPHRHRHIHPAQIDPSNSSNPSPPPPLQPVAPHIRISRRDTKDTNDCKVNLMRNKTAWPGLTGFLSPKMAGGKDVQTSDTGAKMMRDGYWYRAGWVAVGGFRYCETKIRVCLLLNWRFLVFVRGIGCMKGGVLGRRGRGDQVNCWKAELFRWEGGEVKMILKRIIKNRFKEVWGVLNMYRGDSFVKYKQKNHPWEIKWKRNFILERMGPLCACSSCHILPALFLLPLLTNGALHTLG